MGVIKLEEGERWKTDEEISDDYVGFKITEIKAYNPRCGGMQLEFPNGAEDRWDNFIIYDDGKVAFDNWYPDHVTTKIVRAAKEVCEKYKET